jgi:hypothetical protein
VNVDENNWIGTWISDDVYHSIDDNKTSIGLWNLIVRYVEEAVQSRAVELYGAIIDITD